MELTDALLDSILEPPFEASDDVDWCQHTISDCPWDDSSLNPKKRINSLQWQASYWKIDGCTQYGTRFLAYPIKLESGLVPLRQDVYIPGQEHHPRHLRDSLHSSLSVCARGTRGVELGIAIHVRNALDFHVQRNPTFLDDLQSLPFGSRIVFENIMADPRDMTLHVHPAYELERQFCTVRKLQELLSDDIPSGAWPPVVDLHKLRLVRQFNDAVSLVSIEGLDGLHIFKPNTSDPKFLYHELKLLLSMPRHPNIIAPPHLLVIKQSVFGAKRGVCGFILHYHAGGCLRDALARKALCGSLAMETKTKWARQLISALVHIQESAEQYYSDLRPDNVVLTSRSENIVLIDFEQRGNWYSWTAPEVRCLLYLDKVCNADACGALQNGCQWRRLLRFKHMAPMVSQEIPGESVHPVLSAQNRVWSALPTRCRTSAMVYSVGLLLFCIFEGISCFRRNLATSFEFEPDLNYPSFRATPPWLRDCIQRCIDSPVGSMHHRRRSSSQEYEDALDPMSSRLTRDGGKLRMKESENHSSSEAASIRSIVVNSWQQILETVESSLTAIDVDSTYPTRPSLQDILDLLDCEGSL